MVQITGRGCVLSQIAPSRRFLMSFGTTKHQRPNHARSSERRHHAYGHKCHTNQKEKETGPTRIGVLHHRGGAFLRLPLRLMGRHREDPALCGTSTALLDTGARSGSTSEVGFVRVWPPPISSLHCFSSAGSSGDDMTETQMPVNQ